MAKKKRGFKVKVKVLKALQGRYGRTADQHLNAEERELAGLPPLETEKPVQATQVAKEHPNQRKAKPTTQRRGSRNRSRAR